MAGLFDAAIINDPQRLAGLQLGLGLLGAASGTGRGIANAFGGAIQSAQQSQAIQQQRAAQELQRRMHEQTLTMNDRTMQRQDRADEAARAQALAREQYIQSLPPAVQQGIRAGVIDPQKLWERDNPQAKLETIYDDQGREIRAWVTAPGQAPTPVGGAKAAGESDIAQLIREFAALPPNDPRRAIYADALRKATTHAPGTTVTLGSPVPITMPDGSQGLVQPANRPGEPPQLMRLPSGELARPQDKPLTESQAKAATFKSQMEAAERELAGAKIDLASTRGQADVALAGGWTNFFATPEAQKARQAQEQWSESFLRFKTGAAATKDEVLLNVRTFFPQMGDSQAVVEQKRRARAQAMNDISMAAGSGAKAPAQQMGPGAQSAGTDLGGGFRIIGVK